MNPRMNFPIAIFSLGLCLGAYAEKAESWSAALADAASSHLDFSDSCVWRSMSPEGKDGWKDESYGYRIEKRDEGAWSLLISMSGVELRQVFDANLRMLSEEQIVKDPALVKKNGVDRLTWNTEGFSAEQTLFLASKVKKETKVAYDENTTFGQAFSFQFGALIKAGKLEERKMTVILGNQRVEGAVRFVACSDPCAAASEYRYPAEMRTALGSKKYILCDFRLTGLFGAFYPHHFYSVFEVAGENPIYAAYWGGKPGEAGFQWRTEK